jgi:predicted membrane protein
MLLLMVPGKVMKSVREVVIGKLLSYVLLVMVHGQVRDYNFFLLLAFFVSSP